jgi:glycosyltransferase involved in cell wall biosynthesis
LKNKRDSASEAHPRLLVICQLFYPELISTGQTLTELVEKLAELGVEIEVLCAPHTVLDNKARVARLLIYKGITIRRVWATRFPKLNLIGRIANQATFAFSVFTHLLIHSINNPVLVLTNPPFLAPICAFVSKLKNAPFIYLIFDVYPDTLVNLGVLKPSSLIIKVFELLNRFSFNRASTIVVIGRCMKEIIAQKAGPLNSDKIRFVHMWSDDQFITPLSRINNPLAKRWGLKNKFIVTYAGNMGRFHDIETIMDAALLLDKTHEYKDILFLFVGKGHKKKWAIEFKKINNMGNVDFQEHVDKKDLPYMLTCADLSLVSLVPGQEGLSVPSKAYGLMAAGVPIIAIMSDRSEVARVIKEENCGLSVRPGDAHGLVKSIMQLYADRECLEQMGRNGRKAIDEKYNLSAASLAYRDIISTIAPA